LSGTPLGGDNHAWCEPILETYAIEVAIMQATNRLLAILLISAFGICNRGVSQDIVKPDGVIRFATFNCSLNRDAAGQLVADLSSSDNTQAKKVAEIIQRVRPDILLLNEFDFDVDQKAVKLFQRNYLAKSQNGQAAIDYPHYFVASVNTGVDAGVDLNKDGQTGTPDDAFGFGKHPGQYGMVVFSMLPIDKSITRTFQKFLWKDMHNALWPMDPKDGTPYYSEEIRQLFRLSSKSHWDVAINLDGRTIHFLVCHPTPPVFDGAEDRNGTRNHDEIRFWADYVDGADYIYDDAGKKASLEKDALFVVAGDLNADPSDGDSRDKPSSWLLNHPRIQDPKPTSIGGKEQASAQAQLNTEHTGDPSLDTGDFGDRNVGNPESITCCLAGNCR
jgi:hypothetical protein